MKSILANYATQPSTWKGVVNLLIALGVVHVTSGVPDQLADQLANLVVQLVKGGFQVIAAGQALIGLLNLLHDERKSATVAPNPTPTEGTKP